MEKIKAVMELFQKSNLSEMELEMDDFKIRMTKDNGIAEARPLVYKEYKETELKEEVQAEESEYEEITSMLVGTFYASNVQDGDPLVKVGDTVSEGQVVAVIEAMKVMNEIKSPFNGVVKKINVKNSQLVQFGDVIMEIEKDD